MRRRNFCPYCGAELERGTVLCVECGRNLESGERANTRIEAEAERKGEGDDESVGFLIGMLDAYVPGVFSLKVIVCSVFCFVLALGCLWGALFFAMFGAVFVTVAVGALALVLYGTAVAWMLSGHIGLLTDNLLDLDGRRWTLFVILVFGPVVGICALMSLQASGG